MSHYHKKLLIGLLLFLLVLEGAVLVFGSSERRAKFFCANATSGYERIICIKPYVEKITETQSPHVAFAFIRTLQKDGVISDCHVPLHFVGEVHLENSDSLGEALATCPIGCFEGCQHGVVERYIAEAGTLDIANVCTPVIDNSILYRQCLHGLGHGILRHNSTNAHTALASCGDLQSESAALTCEDGVMMEYVDAQLYESHSAFLLTVGTTCATFDKSSRLFDACLNNVGWGLMVATGHNLEQSLNHCLQFENSDLQEQCRQYVRTESEQSTRELNESI